MSGARSTTYALAESFITVAGTVTYETDTYERPDGGAPSEVVNQDKTQATVTLGLRGDPAAQRRVSFDDAVGDGSVTYARLADGRLSSISFNTTGVGARLVAAGATVVAYVGGLAASVVGGGTARRFGTTATRGSAAVGGLAGEGDKDQDKPEPEPATPEERARKAWADSHEAEAARRDEHERLLGDAESALKTWRQAVIDATTPSAARDALAQVRRVEIVIKDAKAEIDRIDTLYKAWRSRTVTVRTEHRAYDLSIKDLGAWSAGTPTPPTSGLAQQVWEHLGVIVRVEPLAERPADQVVTDIQHPLESDRGKGRDGERISWRVPRPVRVWVWRRTKDGGVALESVTNALVVDAGSAEGHLPVEKGLFGEASATIEFGNLGSPSTVTAGSKSALGAFADALKGVPDSVVSGLEAAKKTQAAYVGLEDAREVHRLEVLKRRKDMLQAQLDLKGLEATAEDFAELKRLEQQVLIAEAEGKLASSPPSELALLQEELELARTRAALEALRNGAEPEEEPPSIEEQLANLAARVEALEAR